MSDKPDCANAEIIQMPDNIDTQCDTTKQMHQTAEGGDAKGTIEPPSTTNEIKPAGTNQEAKQNETNQEAKENETNQEAKENETNQDSKDTAVVANVHSEVAQLMQNPGVLAAIQDRLTGMIGMPSGYIQSLPKCVKRRVKALKKLQFESTQIEAKFFEEIHLLEVKYASQYVPLYEKRREVLVGSVEPTDSDSEWPSDEEDDEQLTDDVKTKLNVENEEEKKTEEKVECEEVEEDPKGIPYFWLTVLKNVDLLSDMIQDHDEPIIKCLEDIRVKYTDNEPYGFTLEFFFSSNEYFSKRVLTKDYELKMGPDEADPFVFEGPEIVKCKGCTIDWNKGKNVTVKMVKKTQRHKCRGTKRTVTKQVQNDSFFNFFNPPAEALNDDDEDTEALLAADFEIGQFIRERIIPKAVLYFTGEALEDEEDYDDEEGDEEEADDEDYDEEADPDFNPAKAQNPTECKQQ